MPAPQRILYLEQNTDGTIGGSHYCLLEIVKFLPRERYEPMVGFYQDNPLREEFGHYCRTFLFPVASPRNWMPNVRNKPILVVFIIKIIQKGINFLNGFIFPMLRNIIFLKQHRIGLVHLNNSLSTGYQWLFACKLAGVKCITHNRGKPQLSRLQRVLAKGFNAVICISKFQMNDFRKQGIEIDGRFLIINDGIDAQEVLSRIRRSREETRKSLHIEQTQPMIGMVGNIKRWKGQEIVIRAVDYLRQIYPGLRCLMIGDVSKNQEDDYTYFLSLQALVQEKRLENNISFLGFRKDIPDLMMAMDLLVHASITPEPFGRVILEGLVLGRPVVATKFGGPMEIIENGVSGILVPPEDENALAQAIDSLLEDRSKRERMGEAGKKRVYEKFLLTRNLQEILDLYRRLLSQK